MGIELSKNTKNKRFNRAYGIPYRLRPETVKLVNKLDRRTSPSFNDKLYGLLKKYEELKKQNMVKTTKPVISEGLVNLT